MRREPRCRDNLLRQGEIENRPIKPALQLTCLLGKFSTLQQQMALALDQTERPTWRASIQWDMDQIPRSVLSLLHRSLDSELITILHPTPVQISCIRFMNSVLFLANKHGVIWPAAAFYFFNPRYTSEFTRLKLHLTIPRRRITVRVSQKKERKETKRQAQRWDLSNYCMASIQTKNKGFVCSREQALMSANRTSNT